MATPSVVIQSDASSHGGWGAACGALHTDGRWSPAEASLHINALELLAGSLAVQTFARRNRHSTVLLQMDNQAAISYVNRMGGTHSSLLSRLATELWDWCLARDIHLLAEYLPGRLNIDADFYSRNHSSAEWQLNPAVFSTLQEFFRPSAVDLFALRINAQLPRYVSWRPEPSSINTDAFTLDWAEVAGYAFPPFALIGRVLHEVLRQRVSSLVLIMPLWRGAVWFPLLLSTLTAKPPPSAIPGRPTPRSPRGASPSDPGRQAVPDRLPGIRSRVDSFLHQCPPCSWLPGAGVQHGITTALGHAGIVGVWNSKSILFDRV